MLFRAVPGPAGKWRLFDEGTNSYVVAWFEDEGSAHLHGSAWSRATEEVLANALEACTMDSEAETTE